MSRSIAPALMATSPLYVLLFYWSYRRLPRDLVDAARLEGMGPFAIWRRVAAPLVRPTTFAVGALASCFTGATSSTRCSTSTIPRCSPRRSACASSRTSVPTDFGVLLAAALAVTLPAVLVFLAVQRRFLRTWGGRMARALILALALVAAGSRGGSPARRATAAGTAGRTLQVFGDAEEIAAYRELVAAYDDADGTQGRADRGRRPRRAHPEDHHRLRRRRPPDVFLVNYRNFARFAARSGIDPVGPAAAALKALSARRLLPAAARGVHVSRRACSACRRTSRASSSTTTATSSSAPGSLTPRRDWTYEDIRAARAR